MAVYGALWFGSWFYGADASRYFLIGTYVFPAAVAILVALVAYCLIRDTPQSCGLPTIEKYRNDYPKNYSEKQEEVLTAKEIFFKHVFNNKMLWYIAIANAFVYMVRYGCLDWAPTFLKEAQEAIHEKVNYEKGKYSVKWGGAFENQRRAYSRLAVIVPLTLACMFILLCITFGKFRQAGLVLSIVPLALFGGMLALNLRGMTLNVSSAVGFIAMFGLSIQNGIIMVSQINELRRKGTDLSKAVMELSLIHI